MERIDIHSLTPELLFEKYVSQRKPLVITGVPTDDDFQAYQKWTDIEYLKKTAGEAEIKVEPMHTKKKQYGTNVRRVSKTFGAFLSSLEQEDAESYDYLTTQYDDADPDPAAAAFPEPVRSLLKDVPPKPKVMGNLVLQQMNLWLGRSRQGASSGLHHDFHDNLYILLKGRKRFCLFPPESVQFFDAHGEVEKIHENGLIVYKVPGADEEEDAQVQKDGIRADGLSERDAAQLRVKALEKKMEELQGVEGKEDELEGLEEIYDEAVENMMDYMMDEAEGAEDDEDGDEDDFDEEDEDEEELGADAQFDGVMERISAQIKADGKNKRKAVDDLERGPSAKSIRGNDHVKANGKGKEVVKDVNEEEEEGDLEGEDEFPEGEDDEDDDEDEDDLEGGFPEGDEDDEEDEEEKELARALEQHKATTNELRPEPMEPLSFSQIPTTELHQHLGLKHPQKTSTRLSKAPKPLIVELKPGEMLYLPTSWWHEVTSFSNEPATVADDKGKGASKTSSSATDDSIHMALNYWFHPPDQLTNFKQPYQDELVWDFVEDEVNFNFQRLVASEALSKGNADRTRLMEELKNITGRCLK
ncbi:cupin-like domain-containing protein [Delphinella strobiligena]|nr:cupin-like domain-containing protein [Delphinella strobiligena]